MRALRGLACRLFSYRERGSLSISAVKYQQFIGDIGTLCSALKRLKSVVEAAERQYPRREWHGDAHRLEGAQSLWPQLTGDFYQTLKECESLLARHGRLQNGRATAFANLNWWLLAEGAVDNLIAKLKWHITKVELYATPSQFEAVIKHGRDLQQLRRQVANLERMMIHGAQSSTTLWARVLSPELKSKFEQVLAADRPPWFRDGSDWPLKEGFEALCWHFARSTIKFNTTPELGRIPQIQQFLNLAKAIWILDCIKESQHFTASGAESIWADYMRELEDDLRGQLHRFETGELDTPSEQELCGFPTDLYKISKGEQTDPNALDEGSAGPPGEQLLQLGLLSDSSNIDSSLSVFRESEVDFLFVISTNQADTLGAPRSREVEISIDRHRLVPIYGNPLEGGASRNNIMIFNEKGKRPTEYAFHSSGDVRSLQRALTGYRVHHDMPLFRWRINGPEQDTGVGGGILQLWQYKPLPPMSDPNPSQASNADSIPDSVRSPAPSLSSSRPPQSGDAGLASPREQNGESADYVGWSDFPSMPLEEATSRRQILSPGLTQLVSVQVQDRRRLSGFSNTSRSHRISSSWGSVQSDQTPSDFSYNRVRSNNFNHEKQRPSSTVSGTTLMSGSSVLSPVRGPRNNGTQALRPELPVLVIFTLCNEKYSFLHLTRKS